MSIIADLWRTTAENERLKAEREHLRTACIYAHKTLLECSHIGISLNENSLGMAITGIEQALEEGNNQ